jgi:hypothetical protein
MIDARRASDVGDPVFRPTRLDTHTEPSFVTINEYSRTIISDYNAGVVLLPRCILDNCHYIKNGRITRCESNIDVSAKPPVSPAAGTAVVAAAPGPVAIWRPAGDAGAARAANGYKSVSENLTVAKMPRRAKIVAPCDFTIFQTGTNIARLRAA